MQRANALPKNPSFDILFSVGTPKTKPGMLTPPPLSSRSSPDHRGHAFMGPQGGLYLGSGGQFSAFFFFKLPLKGVEFYLDRVFLGVRGTSIRAWTQQGGSIRFIQNQQREETKKGRHITLWQLLWAYGVTPDSGDCTWTPSWSPPGAVVGAICVVESIASAGPPVLRAHRRSDGRRFVTEGMLWGRRWGGRCRRFLNRRPPAGDLNGIVSARSRKQGWGNPRGGGGSWCGGCFRQCVSVGGTIVSPDRSFFETRERRGRKSKPGPRKGCKR